MEVLLRQGKHEEIIKSIDPGVYSEENMKVVNQAFTEFMAGCTFGANLNAHSVAIIIKIWQTWPQCGNRVSIIIKTCPTCSQSGYHNQMWQTLLQCGNSTQNVAKYAHRVAIIIKMWQTWPQCGNNTQNVANMINDMPNVHSF